MHLAKLVCVLQALDEPKLKRLKDFVHSPYFKVPLASANLFDYLYAVYPGFTEKKLQPLAIARKAKNLLTTADQAWAGTHLLHAIEEFIGLEYAHKDKPGTALHHVHGARELKLSEYFQKDHGKVMEQLTEENEHGIDVFYHKHLYSELIFNERDVQKKPGAANDMSPVVSTLDEFYAVKKLRYLCEFISRGQATEQVFPKKQIAALLKTLEPYNHSKHPYVYVFVQVYHLLSARSYKQSLKHYLALCDLAANHTAATYSPALSEAMGCILNYCLAYANHGHEAWGKEYLWWQELKMNTGRLLQDNKLSPVTFRNVAVVAVNHRSAEWLMHFIAFFGDDLPEDNRAANRSFAKGLVFYMEKKHKEALRAFQQAEARDEPVFNCVLRRWQWISSYECDPEDTDLLENQLLSFTKYLYRSKKELKTSIPAFEKFIFHASKLLSGASDLGLEKDNYFPGKPWLERQQAKR